MENRDEIGMRIASEEFEGFLNDAVKFHISNVYINRYDIEHNEQEYIGPVERFRTLKSRIARIGNGILIEFNHNVFYEFSSGFGVCDYHLKISKPSVFPIQETYTNVKETGIEVLKWLVNKNPNCIVPTTCHREITVLRGLEFRNYDGSMFSIIGSHFEFEDELGKYGFFDRAWVLIDKSAIQKMRYV